MVISKEAQKLDDMMRKVEGMLATADSLNDSNPEAAANYRANAERIMAKYRIEQEDLIKRGDLKIDVLSVMFKEVRAYNGYSEYSNTYNTLFAYVIHHCGVKAHFSKWMNGETVWWLVGYEADIRFAEALLMNVRLVFADRMEPKVDPTLSDMDNVYRLRSAGMERGRVGQLMGWGDKAHQKVTRIYKAACEARGEEAVLTGRSVNVKDFRAAYAKGFASEFWDRLSHARLAIEKELDNGGLVLHGREERILEAMYERWPNLRPSTTPTKTSTKPAKAKPYRPPSKADMRRWEKENNAASQIGRQAGRKAASEINVNNATPRKRL